MNRQATVRMLLVIVGALLAGSAAQAAVKPNSLFTDNAVLQQKVKVPIWGTTDSSEPVVVSIAGQDAMAAPKNGKWRVELAPLASGGPYTMTITQGSERIELKDILVGEVWICSGQSNMEWPLSKSTGGSEAIATAGNEKIRLFVVRRNRANEPQSDVAGKWTLAAPDTVASFSAVGYYFGRELQKQLAVPVGLIGTYWGGTAAEEWTSKDAIEGNGELKGMSKSENTHTLYNGMLAPLAPYAIRGAIWYQGESNAGRAWQYRTLLPTMIKNWRELFGQGDFPFLIVQIAPYGEPADSQWPEIRDAQLHVSQKVPHTALAVTTDVGTRRTFIRKKRNRSVIGWPWPREPLRTAKTSSIPARSSRA